MTLHGIILKNVLIQCERTNFQNSAVIYVKAPHEMADKVVWNALMQFGTVVNLRRQIHNFDDRAEIGVHSLLIKNIKKPIRSFVRVGDFSLPVRYRGQQKSCKICDQTGHFARDCPSRRRCFVCGSDDHHTVWHDRERDDEEIQTPILVIRDSD